MSDNTKTLAPPATEVNPSPVTNPDLKVTTQPANLPPISTEETRSQIVNLHVTIPIRKKTGLDKLVRRYSIAPTPADTPTPVIVSDYFQKLNLGTRHESDHGTNLRPLS